ncbi:MAG: outer membrane protein [Roseiarcus sp.]|jgi:outer membrane immunogenic protein
MKRALLASTALCVILVSGAFASDLPTMKGPPPAPVPPPVFNWTGFYIGGNIGGVWTQDGVVDLDPLNYGDIPGNSNTLGLSGLLGGVQAGYNYQVQSFVLGVEGDLDFSSAKGSFSNFLHGEPAVHSASLPFFGDIRARVGVAFDRFLPYVTGGVVFANLNNSLVDYDYPFSLNRGSTATGWTVGAGVEYAIDNHWSVKAEYLFMQFPDVTASTVIPDAGTYAFKFKDSAQLARVGVNYRF